MTHILLSLFFLPLLIKTTLSFDDDLSLLKDLYLEKDGVFQQMVTAHHGVIVHKNGIVISDGSVTQQGGAIRGSGDCTTQKTIKAAKLFIGTVPDTLSSEPIYFVDTPSFSINNNPVGNNDVIIGNTIDGNDVFINPPALKPPSTKKDTSPTTLTLESATIAAKAANIAITGETQGTITGGTPTTTLTLSGKSIFITTPGLLPTQSGVKNLLVPDEEGLLSAIPVPMQGVTTAITLAKGIEVTGGTSMILGNPVEINHQKELGKTAIGNMQANTTLSTKNAIVMTSTLNQGSGAISCTTSLTDDALISGNGGILIRNGTIMIQNTDEEIAIATSDDDTFPVQLGNKNISRITIQGNKGAALPASITLQGNSMVCAISSIINSLTSIPGNSYLLIDRNGTLYTKGETILPVFTLQSVETTEKATLLGTVSIKGSVVTIGSKDNTGTITLGSSTNNQLIINGGSGAIALSGGGIDCARITNLQTNSSVINYLGVTDGGIIYLVAGETTNNNVIVDTLATKQHTTLQGKVVLDGTTVVVGGNGEVVFRGREGSGDTVISFDAQTKNITLTNNDAITIGNNNSVRIGAKEIVFTTLPHASAINYLIVDYATKKVTTLSLASWAEDIHGIPLNTFFDHHTTNLFCSVFITLAKINTALEKSIKKSSTCSRRIYEAIANIKAMAREAKKAGEQITELLSSQRGKGNRAYA